MAETHPVNADAYDVDVMRPTRWLREQLFTLFPEPHPLAWVVRETWVVHDMDSYFGEGKRAPESMYPKGAPRFSVSKFYTAKPGNFRQLCAEHGCSRTLDGALALVDSRCERKGSFPNLGVVASFERSIRPEELPPTHRGDRG